MSTCQDVDGRSGCVEISPWCLWLLMSKQTTLVAAPLVSDRAARQRRGDGGGAAWETRPLSYPCGRGRVSSTPGLEPLARPSPKSGGRCILHADSTLPTTPTPRPHPSTPRPSTHAKCCRALPLRGQPALWSLCLFPPCPRARLLPRFLSSSIPQHPPTHPTHPQPPTPTWRATTA